MVLVCKKTKVVNLLAPKVLYKTLGCLPAVNQPRFCVCVFVGLMISQLDHQTSPPRPPELAPKINLALMNYWVVCLLSVTIDTKGDLSSSFIFYFSLLLHVHSLVSLFLSLAWFVGHSFNKVFWGQVIFLAMCRYRPRVCAFERIVDFCIESMQDTAVRSWITAITGTTTS